MRLLVIVNVFEPDLGGGVLFSDLCYGLTERGFDVSVRCAYPYYPEWRDKSGENGFKIRRETRRGVEIERFGLFIPRNPNSLVERLTYEASFFASLMRRLPSRGSFDAIMVFCPLMGAVGYAGVARRLTGVPLWLNVQDLPAEAAAGSGFVGGAGRRSSGGRKSKGGSGSGIGDGPRRGERGSTRGWMVRLQDALFNQADLWSTISPAMLERLRDKRRRGQPLLYIPNWLHRSLGDHLAALPDKTGRAPSSPVKLLYSGNLGAKQHLLALCRILHRSDAGFSFRIQAAGSGTGELREWLSAVGDPRFDLRGLSDEPELARALHDADFAVITERPASGGSFIPSKLIPALAAGTPVLAVCDAKSPLGREMAEHEPGPRFSWEDAAAVPELLSSLDAARYAEWQRRALERAAFYDRDRVVDEYARELRRLL
ncbi:MAG: glycosyltransferase [Rhodothermales bacterium]